jgi:hypothetical protein
MCVVWCASSSNARWLIRRIHSSERVAASRNPRARSIAVNPAVMALVMVKRGVKAAMSELAAKGPVLEGGEEGVELCEGGALGGFQPLHHGELLGKGLLKRKRGDVNR